MPWSRSLNILYMSFNAIRENKILAKISEFTVLSTTLKFKYEMRNEIKLKNES